MTIADLLREIHRAGGEVGLQLDNPTALWGKGLTVDLHQILKANRQTVVDLLKAQKQRQAEPDNEQLRRLVGHLLATEIPEPERLVRDMNTNGVVTATHYLEGIDMGKRKPS